MGEFLNLLFNVYYKYIGEWGGFLKFGNVF